VRRRDDRIEALEQELQALRMGGERVSGQGDADSEYSLRRLRSDLRSAEQKVQDLQFEV
jgi:hypothetical protein